MNSCASAPWNAFLIEPVMSCTDCIVRQTGSSDFFERLAYATPGPGELPLAGSFELTLRCNLNCRHCYTKIPAAAESELSIDGVRRVLDALADAGVLLLLLTGGEIFMRSDFRAIYSHAKQRGFLINLYTNATRVDEQLAAFLASAPPRRIEISVYGRTRQTYETVTGVSGSFARFERGVQLLLDAGLPVYFKTMVLKSNAHEFGEIKTWSEKRGRAFRWDAIVNPRLDGDLAPAAQRISAGDIARLQPTSDAAREDMKTLRERARSTPPDARLFKCGAGTKTFHVDPRGFIHPCMMWRQNPYSLLEGTVAGWKVAMAGLRNANAPRDSRCAVCPSRFYCASCAAASLAETGKAGMEADYYCQLCAEREKLLNIC
jgi:MoaA/NifB/PqqE/SkfB family radical SAM enzyme